MRTILRSLLSFLFILIFSATSARAGDVGLSVAASLREAVMELSASFAKDNPAVRFQKNLGSSGALAKQIESGAPADLYFSANVEWMDHLKERKLVNERSITVFAYNTLVFVGKPELKVGNLQDIVKLERIAIGSPKSAPVGDYAMQALKKAGLEKQLENKLVMAKDVRECLMYADRGEADGAFVYRTDAQEMAKNVKVLFTVPQELYPRITCLVALTVTGSKNADAVTFHKFLQTPDAKAILTKHGFMVK